MAKENTSDLIKRFIPIAEAITEMFGSRCEVVLHDLTRPQSSVVFTKNSSVTGRQVGESFRHLFYQVLRSDRFKNDFVSNYKTSTIDGRTIKSTTALIRDNNGDTVGAFCINFDIDDLQKTNDFLNEFVKIENEDVIKEESDIVDNVWDIVSNLIKNAVEESTVPVSEMDKEDKFKIVSFLYDKGLFLIKGSMDEVARSLNISKVTIYGYLDEIKAKRTDEESGKNVK
ncbi:MAG: PAS domain-containing protein [Paenibacillaceae bacterium]